MPHRMTILACGMIALSCAITRRDADAQYAEESTVQAAAAVLNETMATPGHRIPKAMLADAHGVAIIPNVIKGSFVIGARRGKGLLFVKDPQGIWHAPVFVTLTGGNIGWQVGVQSSDIILVFKTERSVQGILTKKLTLGADAAAAAGPVGRQTGVATDGQLQAEIYAYSRSRGLFAGVSIDGSVVRMDQFATGSYYRSAGPGKPATVPPSAAQLTQTIALYAAAEAPKTLTDPTITVVESNVPQPQVSQPTIPQSHEATESDLLRGQLTQIAPELYELLDDNWKAFLALPSSLFLEGPHPAPQELSVAVSRFDQAATDPQYRQLAARPEFQSVYGILKHYQQSLLQSPAALQLPPPPSGAVSLTP